MSPQKNNRQKAWRYGQAAEAICTLSLRLRGYRILARRFKTPLGEIDIIARRGNRIAFIEVKARQDLEQARPFDWRTTTETHCARGGAFYATACSFSAMPFTF